MRISEPISVDELDTALRIISGDFDGLKDRELEKFMRSKLKDGEHFAISDLKERARRILVSCLLMMQH